MRHLPTAASPKSACASASSAVPAADDSFGAFGAGPAGAGDIVIKASQPGNGNFNAAVPIQETLVVNKAMLIVKAVNTTWTAGTTGQVLTGFVERVGDPVPLVTADGSSHPADELVVDALDGMVELAGQASSQIAIAVPAHWTGATLRALRTAMRAKPRLAPNGVPARLVSDAVAALTAIHANPGLPGRGVVALLDFGGGGTSSGPGCQ